MRDAFASCFGSGDLLPIAAMLFIVLTQDIEKIPAGKRTEFLVATRENSTVLAAVIWIAYGVVKVIAMKDVPAMSPVDGVVLLQKFSWFSILILLSVSIFCVIARLKVRFLK